MQSLDRILIIDDEVAVLAGLTRLFRDEFKFIPASSAPQALGILRADGPFAVVIADYRMPAMTGAELLGAVSEMWPETRRVLLTGCADSQALSDAVNLGHVTRILFKPCDPDLFRNALRAELASFHATRAARFKAEGAPVGCVNALVAMLRRGDENAHRRALRTAQLASGVCGALGLGPDWVVDTAAMLSELGSVGAAPAPSDPAEASLPQQRPAPSPQRDEKLRATLEVIAGVAELGAAARLLAAIVTADPEAQRHDQELLLQRRVLEATMDCVELLERGLLSERAVLELRRNSDRYSRPVLTALVAALHEEETLTGAIVPIRRLQVGSILEEEVCDRITGVLIVPAGHELTEASIDRLRSHLDLGRLRSSSCKVRKTAPALVERPDERPR
jgi:CheY-like chemotaxis protein